MKDHGKSSKSWEVDLFKWRFSLPSWLHCQFANVDFYFDLAKNLDAQWPNHPGRVKRFAENHQPQQLLATLGTVLELAVEPRIGVVFTPQNWMVYDNGKTL